MIYEDNIHDLSRLVKEISAQFRRQDLNIWVSEARLVVRGDGYRLGVLRWEEDQISFEMDYEEDD